MVFSKATTDAAYRTHTILCAVFAARYSLGPPYVLLTLLLLILTNLGTRQQGELSAYSVFNTVRTPSTPARLVCQQRL